MLLANFHALHHKSRHAIFTNVWDVQTTTKELLNILRNYSNELTKATGVETCASFYHTVGLQLLDRRNSTNNVAAFFSPPGLVFLSADESYGQMASAPACIHKILDSNLGPNTGSPQIFVVDLNPCRQIQK